MKHPFVFGTPSVSWSAANTVYRRPSWNPHPHPGEFAWPARAYRLYLSAWHEWPLVDRAHLELDDRRVHPCVEVRTRNT